MESGVKGSFKSFFKFTSKSDVWNLVPAIVSMCISSCTSSLSSWIFGKMFSKLVNYFLLTINYHQFISDIKILTGSLLVITVGKFLFSWLGIFFWLRFGENQSLRARDHVYSTIAKFNYDELDVQKNLMGDLAQTHRSIEELRQVTSETFGLLIEKIATIMALMVTSFIQSWAVTLIGLSSGPILFLSSWWFGLKIKANATLQNEVSSKSSKVLNWTFSNSQVIKLFNAKYFEMVNFNKLTTRASNYFFKLSHASSLNLGILRFFGLMLVVQIFWFGIFLIKQNKINVSQLITCFSTCIALGGNISDISTLVAELNYSYASMEIILNFIGKHSPMQNKKIADVGDLISSITLKDVFYSYKSRESQQVLNGVSLELKMNEMNYIVGKSGSGKSTIAQIFAGLLKPSDGNVFLNQLDMTQLDFSWISQQVMYLEQFPLIFDDTLEGNIKLGTSNGSIETAYNFAGLENLGIDMKSQTLLSQTKLPGGQRQRLALARARFRDPQVLILDESLSAFDIMTKQLLLERIRQWRSGKTTIMITHDIQSINPNEFVFLVNNGSVTKSSYKKDLTLDEFGCTHESQNIEKHQSIVNQNMVVNNVNEKLDFFIDETSTILDEEGAQSEKIRGIFPILWSTRSDLNKFLFLIGLIFSIINAVSVPLFSNYVSQMLVLMVDIAMKKKNISLLGILSGKIIALAFTDAFSHYLFQYIFAITGEKWVQALRKKTFIVLIEQDTNFYDSNNSNASDLTSLIVNDTRDLRAIVSIFIPTLVNLVVMVSIGTIWAIVKGPKLALVGLSFIPAIFIVTSLYSIILSTSEARYKDKIAESEKITHSYATNFKSIYILGVHEKFSSLFTNSKKDILRVGYIRAFATGFGFALSALCIGAATATVFYYGMTLVGSFHYTQETFFSVISILTFTFSNTGSLISQLPDITRGQRAGTRIINLMNLEKTTTENSGSLKLIGKKSNYILEFSNVSFHFPGRSFHLDNITFTVNYNEVVAIVGASGSGKSTLMSLITRLHSVDSGKIFIAGKEINSIELESLRNFIAVVPQTPIFFEGSIIDNLTYGLNPNLIYNDDIIQALKLVGISDFIMSLENGWHTVMGEGIKTKMSGGQLQRLSIARALIRKPKLLILDEPTSSLDNKNALLIIEMLQNLPSTTILVITHSTEVMNSCDRRIVLQNNSIVQ